jgi:hypothetical protein
VWSAALLSASGPRRRGNGFNENELSPELGLTHGGRALRSGHRYHVPRPRPRIPASLTPVVAGISWLNDRPRYRPAAVPLGGLKPTDVAVAYDIAPLQDQRQHGQGQTVAMVSFDSFHPRTSPPSIAR